MFGKLGLAAALAAVQILPVVVPLQKAPPQIERPRAPIAEMGPLWASTCKDWDDYDKPAPPVRIHGTTYLVGSCGISSILIVGDHGDILIDGGTVADAGIIAGNIHDLGYRVQDVKLILTSHEHFDHVGGIAQLQRMSGATVVTSAPAAGVLASGQPSRDDPQFGLVKSFPAVEVGRIVGDGDEVRLGNLMLTAMTTPGHTPGALSWRWVGCDGGVCLTIVYADSLSPVSNETYRFSDHPAYLRSYRASIAKIAASPCDILLTPHPSASGMPKRFALGKPLLDEGACRSYAESLTKRLDERLAKEAGAK
jgi:metallo-beta-lactamase class B